MQPNATYLKNNNAHLYYETAGSGQPLVLIHAGVADSRQWNNEFAAFAPEFHVLRYDMRGFGKSSPVAGQFSHMDDLLALLEHLQWHQPLVLLGCSMGGTLAMDFALEYPERVKALVMVGSGPSGLELDVPPHPQQENLESIYEAGELDRVAELEAQIWFDGMGRTPNQVNQEMRQLALEMNRLALTHESSELGEQLPNTATPAAKRLEKLQIPVLVMVGEHDLPYMQAAADVIVDRLPDARKVLLEDAAHLPNLDHPQLFQDAVRSFLLAAL